MNAHPTTRRLLAAALLSAVVATAAACGDDSSASDTTAAAVAELSASASASDRLAAAVQQTLGAGPIRVTTIGDGYTTTSQLDYANKTTYSERTVPDAVLPVHSVLMREGIVLVRLAEDTDGAQAGVWYRLPDDEDVQQMMAAPFDIEWVKELILSATSVTASGTEDVEGTEATHIVVTPDADVLIDLTLKALPEEMRPTQPDALELLRQQVPASLHYWVDGDGYLVKEDDGFEVKTYSEFGSPLDMPDVDASTVEYLPGV